MKDLNINELTDDRDHWVYTIQKVNVKSINRIHYIISYSIHNNAKPVYGAGLFRASGTLCNKNNNSTMEVLLSHSESTRYLALLQLTCGLEVLSTTQYNLICENHEEKIIDIFKQMTGIKAREDMPPEELEGVTIM